MKVSVVKCNSYNEKEVYKAVKKSIDLIGGIKIKKGSKVLLKPNVLSARKPEAGITTHPSVAAAVCRILKPMNVKVMVGDSSGMGKYGYTSNALEISGMKKVAERFNAELISFEGLSKKVEIKGAKVLKKVNIAKPVLNADYIINLPKLKTHTLMKYTGAVKNMFGSIPGAGKSKCHTIAPKEEHFGHLLLDLYSIVKPQLNIIDGVVGIEGNGPGAAGIKKKTNIIAASKDAVALDLVAAKIIGYNPMEIKTNKLAIERGIFKGKVEVVGKKNVEVKYKQPADIRYVPAFVGKFVFSQAMLRPFVIKDKCRACGICIKACPAKTIKLVKGKAHIFDKKCLKCYCCHELCPYNAIELKRPPLRILIDFARVILQKLQ
ncbi:DUF362 domain-containing protein [Candidatus Woesearchaeota archaeon]|nr:DUF362 domain-containing protein [Candidatus Woesearchaeota archaeon]